jgi:hypothetical protein
MRVALALLVIVVATSAEAAPGARRGGGTTSDAGQAVTVDASGNAVLTGGFAGSANFGGGPLASAGWGDVLLAKYAPAGTHLWSKRLGGTKEDRGYTVAVDPRANCDGSGGTNCIVVAGVFRETGSFGGTALVSAGNGDIFLARYTATGVHLWSKRYGNIGEDVAYAVAVDPATGNIFLTGSFHNSITIEGVTLDSAFSNTDLFVAKFAPSGTGTWAKNFSNNSSDYGRAIALDSQGDVILAGSFAGSIDFGNGTGSKSSVGYEDVALAKLRGSDGVALWASRYGSTFNDIAYGVAVDGADNIAVTGSFQTTVSFGGTSFTANGTDIFIAKYAGSNGAHTWSRQCTGTYNDLKRGNAITTDSADNVIATGNFAGAVDFGTGALTAAGGTDTFVAKYTAAGVPDWSQRFGSLGASNTGTSIATDPTNDDILVTGFLQGTINASGQVLKSAGADDVFLLRLAP